MEMEPFLRALNTKCFSPHNGIISARIIVSGFRLIN